MNKKNIRVSHPTDRQSFWEDAVQVLESIFEMKYANAIEEVAAEMEADDRVVLILYPEEPMLVTSYNHRNDSFHGFEFDDASLEDEFGLSMVYDSACVVTLGENDYLVEAPLMITNIDKDGNETSVSVEDAFMAADFLKERETFIEVDGEAYQAFRLTF